AGGPRPWEQLNDRELAAWVPQYPNAVMVNWYRASGGHPEYFSSDGVHLTPVGAQAYARLVVATIASRTPASATSAG
ncbi:MAG: SGNH/GDSL hydrolase family protein, partial [Actinomycetes bacterium]